MGLLKKLFGKSARRTEAKALASNSGLKAIDPLSMPTRELERLLKDYTAQEIATQWANDPWLKNYVMSVWEKAHDQTEMTTFPWHYSMGLLDACNADCIFCPKELKPRGKMSMQTLKRLATLLPYARTMTLTGGEPTLHPQFRDILLEIGKCIDPRCSVSMITNGTRVQCFTEECCKVLSSISVSVNAATPQTHDRMMHLGPNALPQVLDCIRHLRRQIKFISLSFVVTRENLQEIPAFLELAQELQVNAVYLRTLNPPIKYNKYIPDYESMAPYHHPEFSKLFEAATRAIAECKLSVITDPKQWALRNHGVPAGNCSRQEQFFEKLQSFHKTQSENHGPINTGQPLPQHLAVEDPELQVKQDPYLRRPPFSCGFPFFAYHSLTQDVLMEPCCFMPRVPGFDTIKLEAAEDFFALHNSPALVALRRSLRDGPLYPICKTCAYQMNY